MKTMTFGSVKTNMDGAISVTGNGGDAKTLQNETNAIINKINFIILTFISNIILSLSFIRKNL